MRAAFGKRRASQVRVLVLEANADLIAAVVADPGRVFLDHGGTGSQGGIPHDLLLDHRGGVEQIGAIKRDFDIVAQLVADRGVEEAITLLVHRQADTAVEVIGQEVGPIVIGQTSGERTLFVQQYDIVRFIRNTGQAVRVEHSAIDLQAAAKGDGAAGRVARLVGQVRVVDTLLFGMGIVGLNTETIER